MKLHGDVISPFVRMCLVSAHHLGLAEKLALAKTGVKPTEVNETLERLSPIAKVPVLETDHGHGIYDSRVIMEYLAHHAGSDDFIPNDGVKRFRVLTLLALAQGTADAAVSLRYEQAQRPKEFFWSDYATRLTARINAGLNSLEKDWSDVMGLTNAGTIATACMLAYIDFRHDALNWRNNRPKLTAFFERMNALPCLKAWPLT
jgi:glutathione S-transferase